MYREVLTLLKNIKDMDIPMLLDYIRKLQEDIWICMSAWISCSSGTGIF